MNARPQTAESPIHYFVDEAGDPTLFNRKGRVIVGDEGCSRYFMLGKLEISEPEVLSAQLAALRQELVTDPYFKAVPSMRPGNRKTALAFHAKDDVSEVRRRICFAKRGNKTRNAAFREALKAAAGAFAASFGFAHPATNDVVSSTPPHCPGLQAVDYYLWALQRFYEHREDRFLDLIWPQVGEIHDLDRLEDGRRGVFYTKQKPLNLAAFEKKKGPGI
jgi:hypothetical protein